MSNTGLIDYRIKIIKSDIQLPDGMTVALRPYTQADEDGVMEISRVSFGGIYV